MAKKKVTKAVFPAAGLGTRFLPATKAQPKEMLPIFDTPAIQYVIEEAVAAGLTEILIITGRNKRAIEDHFDRSVELEMILKEKGKKDLHDQVRNIAEMCDLYYLRQKNPKGLGHAILCAKDFVGDEPFAVLLADDIIDHASYGVRPGIQQLIDVYEKTGTSVLGLQAVDGPKLSDYGVLDPEKTDTPRLYKAKDLVEKPALEDAPSNLTIVGRYLLTPGIFPLIENARPGKGGEIQITDSLREIAKTEGVYGWEMEGRRYDIGDKLGFFEATLDYAIKKAENPQALIDCMRERVSFKIPNPSK